MPATRRRASKGRTAIRAPGGFERLEDVATRDELEAVVRGYASLAKFSQADVNRR